MGLCRLPALLRPSGLLCNSGISSFSDSPFFPKSSNPLPFFSSSCSSAALQTPNPNLSNFNISEFFVRDCGFPPSRLALLNKTYPLLGRSTSIEKARRVVDTFRKYGFCESQIQNVLVCYPPALSIRNIPRLEHKLEVMESFGFTKEDIADVVSRCPLLTHVRDVGRNIESLLSAFGNAKSFLEAVKKFPGLLAMTPKRVEAQIEHLRQSGFEDHAIRSLVYRSAITLLLSPQKTVRIIKCLRDIGVPEDSKTFQTAFICMNRGGCNFDEKGRILAKAGLSEDQIKQLFRKNPVILSRSLEQLQRVMDYLVSAGLSPDVIVKYPKILVLSIEKRIKPRHEAFKYVSASGSFSKLKSLGRFIQMGEKEFREKFVEGNPDAHQLLKIYGSVSSANRKKLGQS